MNDMTAHQNGPYPAGMTAPQTTVSAVIGIVLWFVAAMLCKMLAPFGVHEGALTLITYVLIAPGILPVIVISAKIAKLSKPQIFAGISVMTMVAMVFDGVALRWLPFLYGSSITDTAGAGGMILWGAAWGMIWAFILNRHEA